MPPFKQSLGQPFTYGSYRPCGDYRRLNTQTVTDLYSIPNALDFNINVHGATSRELTLEHLPALSDAGGPDGVVVSVSDYHAKGPGFDSLRGQSWLKARLAPGPLGSPEQESTRYYVPLKESETNQTTGVTRSRQKASENGLQRTLHATYPGNTRKRSPRLPRRPVVGNWTYTDLLLQSPTLPPQSRSTPSEPPDALHPTDPPTVLDRRSRPLVYPGRGYIRDSRRHKRVADTVQSPGDQPYVVQFHRQLDLGLGKQLGWTFTIADVHRPIIGADFLFHHELLVDIQRHRLVDRETKKAATSDKVAEGTPTVYAIPAGSPYAELLQQFPDARLGVGIPLSLPTGSFFCLLDTRVHPSSLLFHSPGSLHPPRVLNLRLHLTAREQWSSS
ncbi:hypothetical protein AAG570_012940 [Ranatra chinensis]|uniref:Uncharacterized protein n=1 Tax=Ranatra chinensis TaxID=642074 RepID=A0ABD0YTY2_9HEMI